MSDETKLNLEAIKARCAAATEGPWTVVIHAYEDDASLHILRSDGANVAMSSHDGDPLAFLSADDGEFIAAARTDVPALVAEVERLRFLLAECFRITGADPDGNDDAMLAGKAVDAVRRLRASADHEGEKSEEWERCYRALEAKARDTLREADLRLALEDADRDCLGCGAKLMHGEVHRDGCAIGRLRVLLAKGGAA